MDLKKKYHRANTLSIVKKSYGNEYASERYETLLVFVGPKSIPHQFRLRNVVVCTYVKNVGLGDRQRRYERRNKPMNKHIRTSLRRSTCAVACQPNGSTPHSWPTSNKLDLVQTTDKVHVKLRKNQSEIECFTLLAWKSSRSLVAFPHQQMPVNYKAFLRNFFANDLYRQGGLFQTDNFGVRWVRQWLLKCGELIFWPSEYRVTKIVFEYSLRKVLATGA